MRMVVTLIAGPAGRPLLPDIAAAIGGMLPAATLWLAPGEACDLFFEAADAAASESAARAVIGGAAIDLVLQPAAERKKRLLVADLEATIIENEMLDELAELLGIGPRVAEITRRAMNGELDFVEALEARVRTPRRRRLPRPRPGGGPHPVDRGGAGIGRDDAPRRGGDRARLRRVHGIR